MNTPRRTWVNVHEPVRRSLEEEADELADVFAAVSDIEQDRIETFHINLSGNPVMNTTVTAPFADLDEQIVHTRNTYGDPMSIIEKHLPDTSRDYFARVASSLHWYMQMAVINAARAVLFDLYSADEIKPEETPAEHFNNFCLDIHDVLKRESIWTENEACVAATEKHRLMLNWGDDAEAAAMANDRDFTPKTLSELLLDEKPAKVRMETAMNYEVLAERSARKASSDPIVIEAKKQERMKMLIARDTMLAMSRVNDNRKLIGVIEVIIEHIEKNTPRSVTFTALDKKFMRSAIDFTMNTLERVAETDMARDRKTTTQAFMRILDAQDKAIDELKAYRKMHANEAEELESSYAGDPVEAHNRAQKEAAANRH